jgi:GH24 family phage-related lysozyme (muramidase)/uncharacterized protein YcbK (DUF882 family)
MVQEITKKINLNNFFKYYEEDNQNHLAAVEKLAASLPVTLINDDAEWVKTYRTPVSSTQHQLSLIPECGLNLIKEFEGLGLEAYPDPRTGDKPITIGYGSTRKLNGGEWSLGDTITEKEAKMLLEQQLIYDYLPYLTRIPCWADLNENQHGALISFAWNCGRYFYGSRGFETITRVLKNRSFNRMREALMLYVNPGSNVEKGLRRRRAAEADLWESRPTPHEAIPNGRVATAPMAPQMEAIRWDDMNYRITKNFTLGENLRGDRRRIPNDKEVRKNIFKIMNELQKIRDEYGAPIIITSGYRPYPINLQVGGVPNSRHVDGDAVDIAPEKGDIWKFQQWLDENWHGALGYGAPKGFVHLDCRNGEGWRTGGEKGVRWNY